MCSIVKPRISQLKASSTVGKANPLLAVIKNDKDTLEKDITKDGKRSNAITTRDTTIANARLSSLNILHVLSGDGDGLIANVDIKVGQLTVARVGVLDLVRRAAHRQGAPDLGPVVGRNLVGKGE